MYVFSPKDLQDVSSAYPASNEALPETEDKTVLSKWDIQTNHPFFTLERQTDK